MKDQAYTDSWISGFAKDDVINYDRKFRSRWEKAIKHAQQVAFIRPYLSADTYWCDCPIGSGRLMDAMQTSHMVGIDRSPAFLDHNREKGIECHEGDLFDLPFENAFDVVTSMHTIFAFDEHEAILEQYMKMLRPGGRLIIDIVNQDHIARRGPLEDYPYRAYMTRDRIVSFFEALGHRVLRIEPHDFWDSVSMNEWRQRGPAPVRKCKHILWRIMQHSYTKLHFHRLFCWIERQLPEDGFCKYLTVVEKAPTP